MSKRLACLCWIIMMLASAPSARSQAALDDVPLMDRRVLDVIAVYEAAGYEFLYSTGLVRPSLRFRTEPAAQEPIDRLKLGLEPIGLTLRKNEVGVWVIVKHTKYRDQRVQGRVLDAQTREPLSGVRIEFADQILTTDEQGYFELTVSAAVPVRASLPGYQEKRVYGSPQVQSLLEIPLSPEPPMDEIVVVSSRYAVQNTTTEAHLVDFQMLESLPKLGEDPLRITSHLPGMASIGVSAKPHIRGGLQDELLVIFNNLELLEPFHLKDFQSIFSSFNPSLIQSIDVYTGGFPARYGDRMSGVMDISPAEDQAHNGGELTLSLLNASALFFGRTASGRGQWLVSGRRGNLDIVTKEVNSTVGEPSYSDWFAQYRHQLDNVTELDVGLIAYNDDIELADFDTDGEVAESRYRNVYGWAQLHRFWSPRVDGTTLFYYGSIKHDREGFLVDEDLDNGEARVDDRRDFELWAAGQTLAYEYSSRWLAETGVRLNYQSGSYDYDGFIERGELADFLGNDLSEVRAYRLRPSGLSGGAFVSVRARPWDNWLVEAGLRWDFQEYADADQQISPRLSVKLDLGEHSELRASVGRFHQPEGIHELQVGDGISEYQDVQAADHFILSWYQQFGDSGLSLRAEAFSKRFRDPKRRFENLFNPLVLLPELASDRVEIAPSRARARGFEATLKYTPDDTLTAWLTYSQTEVEDRIEGRWQPRAWEQGDTISAGISWHRDAWRIGATLLWNDGWRTTRLPTVIAEDEQPLVQPYGARLRDYISLDVQISRTWQWPSQSLTAFLDVTNVFSRHNVGGIEYDVEEDEDAGQFLLTTEEETLWPLVPSIGVRWRF